MAKTKYKPGISFKEDFKEQMKNPDFKKLWEEGLGRHQLAKAIIGLRIKHELTQKQLADKVGTTQAVISRIENGSQNITVDYLNKIALAFGKKLKIEFVDDGGE